MWVCKCMPVDVHDSVLIFRNPQFRRFICAFREKTLAIKVNKIIRVAPFISNEFSSVLLVFNDLKHQMISHDTLSDSRKTTQKSSHFET